MLAFLLNLLIFLGCLGAFAGFIGLLFGMVKIITWAEKKGHGILGGVLVLSGFVILCVAVLTIVSGGKVLGS